jgi:RNA polymerase sigma factor (sigma-70 family)
VSHSQPAELTLTVEPHELDEDEPSQLALALRAGDQSVLPALHRALRPLMRSAFARYSQRPGALPAMLDPSDLEQESWLILADLAQRWRPAGGAFGAYFRVSFPWELARYVKHNSPSRRARGVLVLGAELPDIQEALDLRTGADGREWDGDLAWSELLESLSEMERAVLLLHLGNQKSFRAIGQALKITRPSAFRLYQRALRQVERSGVRVGRQTIDLGARDPNAAGDAELTRLVRALHAGALGTGSLPGRAWLMARTGLTERRLNRLMARLVEAGCIVERSRRRAGRLAHASPRETLEAVGLRPAAD